MKQLRFVSLFSGIGGLDLGLERSGMKCVAHVERDDFCRGVLAKHWPDVPQWGDITTLDPTELPDHDVICGGFPCQDISLAGHRAGITGSRSGLWKSMLHCVRLVRPLYVVVENVAALLSKGMGTVLGDLAEDGYDAEWDCIPAAAVGAPHLRERVFIVANSNGERLPSSLRLTCRTPESVEEAEDLRNRNWPGMRQSGSGMPDWVRWVPEGEFLRVDDGVRDGLDRYRSCGNAVVPHVAEVVGRVIMENQA